MIDDPNITLIIMSVIVLIVSVALLAKRCIRSESRYEEPEFKPLIDKWEPEN